ncbi:MAG: phytoene/squalene synthase family protein [Methyloligellaceae bacterium]
MSGLEDSVVSQLKLHSPDFYNSIFFAPADKRKALTALYAFAMELDKIPDSVSEPALGEIRLQWWRDTLEKCIKGDLSGNPLADTLGEVIVAHNLPIVRIQEMIDARSFELSDDIFPDDIDLKIYLKKTYISMIRLASLILEKEQQPDEQQACEDVGLAYGYAMTLFRMPLDLSRGRIYLPQSMIDQHSVELETLFQGKHTSELAKAIEELGSLAIRHYGKFKKVERGISSKFSPAFLPVTLVQTYVSLLADNQHDILRELVRINPLSRLWKYWRAAAFGTF